MFRICVSGGVLALLCAGAAWAQSWPARPIVLIVPFAAGGGIDARAADGAAGRPDVLDDDRLAEPDGYTFLIGNSGTHAYSQSVYKKRPYDASADFTPVGLATESPRLLDVRKDLPVANLQEFVAYAKANHLKMQFGSAGVGAGTHLPCVLLNRAMGVEVTHIPYRGEGPAVKDLIAGRIDYMCNTIQTGVVQAKAGRVKAIAVMAPSRSAIVPDVPTAGEQGLPGVESSVWNAFFLPKGAPRPVVEALNRAMSGMLDDPEIRKRLEGLGLEIVSPERRAPEYLAKFVAEEIDRWGKIVRAAGVSAD